MKNYVNALLPLVFLMTINSLSHAQHYRWGHAWGSGSLDFGRAIDTDERGNVYAGLFSIFAAHVISYDSTGQFRWQANINGEGTKQVLGLHADGQGNVYATGTYTQSIIINSGANADTIEGGTSREIFVLSFDTDGNYHWGIGLTGPGEDHGQDIASDPNGNIYVTGTFSGSTEFDPGVGTFSMNSAGQEDIFVSSYDASGNFRWARRSGGFGFDWGRGVGVGPNGLVYVGGTITGTSDFDPVDSLAIVEGYGWDAFFVAYDTTGLFQWVRSIGGNGDDFCRDMTLDHLGNIYLVGEYEDTVDFDLSTNTFELISSGETDIYLAKYNPQGQFAWVSSMGGSNFDRGHSVSVDSEGRAYITGRFETSGDFDPGTGTKILTNASGPSAYLGAYDPQGGYIWAFAIDGSAVGEAVNADAFGSVYMTGDFAQSIFVDPSSSATPPLFSHGNWDAFILKYGSQSTMQTPLEKWPGEKVSFAAFPNPATETINILPMGDQVLTLDFEYQIFNMQGKALLSGKGQTDSAVQLDIRTLPVGMYFVQLAGREGNVGTLRFVKR